MRIKIHPRVLFTGAAVVGLILLSPKWTFAPAAWIAPALVLIAIKDLRSGKAFLLAMSILLVSGLIANWRVMPFPHFVFVFLSVQLAVIGALPYWISGILIRRMSHWTRVLVFPCLAVVYDFILSFGGGGTMGSIAYTQIENLPLMQFASITGIWGISLLIYIASSLVYIWHLESTPPMRLMRAFAIILGVLMFWGTIRIGDAGPDTKTIRVASISAWNVAPLKTVYHDAIAKEIVLDPSTLTQTSPELVELNKALALFVEDPINPKFEKSRKALVDFQDSLLVLAEREAKAGAKLIAFSEAVMLTIKPDEADLIRRAICVAKENEVWLVLAPGTFLPGKIEPGKKFIENKAILIGPSGTIENVFFKNKPVPFVEGSVPGDGEVPVVASGSGRIATSICYDADFPPLMRKAGKKEADLMILPSGDWREISPMHSNVARVRAIENGFSLLRPASGGVSLACDRYGRTIAKRDFYDSGEKILVASLRLDGMRTIYTQLGDVIPWTCLILLVLMVARTFFTTRFRREEAVPTTHRQPIEQD